MSISACVFISAVKISALMQAIKTNFQFNVFKLFNAGAGLGLATSLITDLSVCFFLTRRAFIQSQNMFTSTFNWRRFTRA